jgi:hypothetical protein
MTDLLDIKERSQARYSLGVNVVPIKIKKNHYLQKEQEDNFSNHDESICPCGGPPTFVTFGGPYLPQSRSRWGHWGPALQEQYALT